MSDRSLSRDMAEHARRATGQPEPALREQIAEAVREAPVRGTVMRMTVLTELYGPVDALADAVLAIVQQRLDAKQAEIGGLRKLHGVYEAARLGNLIGLDEESAVAVRGVLAETEAELHRYRAAWQSARRRATAEQAKATRLVALIERGFDTHMQFGVIEPDGTTTMLPCADWCYACKLEKAERHVEELQDKLLSFGDNGGCCCSYEGPGDVCLSHSPTVRQLTAERDDLRAQLVAAGLVPVEQPPGAVVLECSRALLRTHGGASWTHHSHTWETQPGAPPVWCPGVPAAKAQP